MENKEIANSEIDLVELVRIFFQKLNQFFNWLNSLFNFAFKNVVILLLALIIGGAVGYFYKNSTDKTYSSKVILKSNYADNDIVAQLIAFVDEAIEDENDKFFNQNELQLSSEFLEKISFSPFSEDDDSLKNRSPFFIELRSTNGVKLPEIQSEIVNYLISNSYIQLKNTQSFEKSNKQLSELNKEILSLDSLKNILKTIEKVQTMNGNSGVIPYIDPTAVSQEQLNLIKDKIDIEVNLLDKEVIRVISPVMAKNKPDLSEKKTGAIFGILLAFILFVVMYRNRNSWKWVRS